MKCHYYFSFNGPTKKNHKSDHFPPYNLSLDGVWSILESFRLDIGKYVNNITKPHISFEREFNSLHNDIKNIL